MSDSNNAGRCKTVFHFISQPEYAITFPGNCLDILRGPIDGTMRLYQLDDTTRLLINLADVSHAEVMYE